MSDTPERKIELVNRPTGSEWEFTENRGYTAHPMESPPPPPDGFATPMQSSASDAGESSPSSGDAGEEQG